MKRFFYTTIVVFLYHLSLFGQVRMVINGTAYYHNDVVYLGCNGNFSAIVEGQVGGSSSWTQLYLDNYGSYSIPSGWSSTFQPASYNKTSIGLSSNLPANGGILTLAWTYPFNPGGTISVRIQTTPQVYFTSAPGISSSNSSNTYSVYAATSGNINWAGYGGVQVNGSSNYSSTNESATVSTQGYGGLLEVTATNACGTSPALTASIYTPYIQNTTVNGNNGSSATVSYIATLSLDTRGTATGANWYISNGTGSISPYGTSCNAYPNNFVRIVGEATNASGTGQNATFYIWKDGFSGYRMAYPNPAKDQINLEFEDAIIPKELLKELSLVDEKGKIWQNLNISEAQAVKFFDQNKRVTFNTKELPRGTYFLHIKLGDKLTSERIVLN